LFVVMGYMSFWNIFRSARTHLRNTIIPLS
jgi:hypothetical protein